MGEKILLRLRPAWDPDAFYSEEDVVHTMLHEAVIPTYTCVWLSALNFVLLISSRTSCMDHTIRTSTSSCPVSKKSTTNSSAPDMQAKDSSPTGVDWVKEIPQNIPRISLGSGHSKLPRRGEEPMSLQLVLSG